MTDQARKKIIREILALRARAMKLENRITLPADDFKLSALRKAAEIITHMEGLSNEVIARRVGVFPATFKRHYRRDLWAMGFETRRDRRGQKGGWFVRQPPRQIDDENATSAT